MMLSIVAVVDMRAALIMGSSKISDAMDAGIRDAWLTGDHSFVDFLTPDPHNKIE